MSVTFIINFNIKPENADVFVNIMQDVKTGLPHVEGCLGVDIHQNSEDDLSYMLVEVWQSQALHQVHIANLSANGQWDKIAGLLAIDPVGHYYRVL